tara:strand:+ start:852 stop:1313 length:462 start_codon:yes stop_codon:yes gene_type:complete
MGFKTKEQQREYNQKYYKAKREQILKQKKEYGSKHKKEKSEYNKKYREENRDKLIQYSKEYNDKHKQEAELYRKSEIGRKNSRIRDWRRMGVISDDYDKLYEKYINTTTCDSCNIQLTENIKYNTSTTRCLDHNHETGQFRNVLCNKCNVLRK